MSVRREDLREWVIAVVVLIVLEAFALARYSITGPLAANMIVICVMALAFGWSRRAPLAYVCLVMSVTIFTTIALFDIGPSMVGFYVAVAPAIVAGGHASFRRALWGLGICIAADVVVLGRDHAPLGNWGLILGVAGASWVIGRGLRTRRLLAQELTRKAERIEAERESRERLAVTDERSRIARELHAIIAGRVSEMVVQAEAAERAIDERLEPALAAMTAIEETGRQALGDMRRVLGVLRRAGETAELAPQPGVGQIHSLVERERESGRDVELEVEGEPGPLPASADLAVYRILEDALSSLPGSPMSVLLSLGEREVSLDVTARSDGAPPWPTVAMQERVGICDGEIAVDEHSRRLSVRLPCVFEEVLA